MAKIVLATIGSLGDLHPMIALGLELNSRGHEITVAAMGSYRENIEAAGFRFMPKRAKSSTPNTEQRSLAMRLRKY
jgi:rhamnosyltransferase subunit B